MAQHRSGATKGSLHIDQLKESERQTSIFRANEELGGVVDLGRLRATVAAESQIPTEVIDAAIHQIRLGVDALGLSQPAPTLIGHWLSSLLREQGFSMGDISLQSLELSLNDVEMDMYHPLGSGLGADQNPEASSQRIAARIKSQFAGRRIYQPDVISAHDEGSIHLLHLGAIDRPHDVFLTPDYLKAAGLPVTSGAPSAGPAKRADVLLAHLIRFSHELQNHFAGDIQWGYVNTLLLPYLYKMNETEMHQFVQQLLFEFGQLDIERGGLNRKLVLDLDFDLPRQLAGLPAIGLGGEVLPHSYSYFQKTLELFNEVTLDILEAGDAQSNPFHSPLIVYHFNQPNNVWHHRHQKLMDLCMRLGNPSIGFSYYQRNFGALGRQHLNDPDFLRQLRNPAQLRGFSTSSIALNLPRLVHPEYQGDWATRLARVMEISVSAHRQKRLFLSRLMAFGNRGPLQFLRHKIDSRPFLKIDRARQPMHLIGLAEAAALYNGSPLTNKNVVTDKCLEMVQKVKQSMEANNRTHKLGMFLTNSRDENVSYRFAALDLRQLGSSYSGYVLHQPDQAQPIYSEGTNILAFSHLRWRERMTMEGKLHELFNGGHNFILYLEQPNPEDATLSQKIYQHALSSGISQLQMAPDLQLCRSCCSIFGGKGRSCPTCSSTLISPYGLCQTNYSPVHSWCLGKRSEWKIRQRMDTYKMPVQTQLPW